MKDKHGKTIDLSKTVSTTKAETRDYEIIKDSDQIQGVLTVGDYMCPKCDKVEVFSYLEQTRASDEPETRMLTCKNCGHGWREY
jgi:DNA-directed RNA polymerase subunit M